MHNLPFLFTPFVFSSLYFADLAHPLPPPVLLNYWSPQTTFYASSAPILESHRADDPDLRSTDRSLKRLFRCLFGESMDQNLSRGAKSLRDPDTQLCIYPHT